MKHALLILLTFFIGFNTEAQTTSKFKRINGLPNQSVMAVAVHPENTGYAAGTWGGGVYIQHLANVYTINKSTSDFPTDNIYDLAWQGDSLWVASDSGLICLYGSNFGEMNHYSTSTSEIPSNNTVTVHVAKYNGNNAITVGMNDAGTSTFINGLWFHNEVNATPGSIASNNIKDIVVDNDGNIWAATANSGVSVSDNYSTWTSFNMSNSDLPSNTIEGMEVDPQGNVWFGTGGFGGGVASFNGASWFVYNQSNANLPSNLIYDICYFNDSIIWLATFAEGMVELNLYTGMAGKHYTSANSDLTDDFINDFDTDDNGTLYIATGDGLWLFNEEGFIGIHVPKTVYELNVNVYPNPTNGDLVNVSIDGNIREANVKIFDITGKQVYTIAMAGSEAKLDLSNLVNGVYTMVVETEEKKSTVKIVLS